MKSVNKNYQAGRRLEYARAKHWRELGYEVVRSSGSHGIWDLCAVKPGGDVILIQCKRVKDKASGLRLIEQFKENPPIVPGKFHLVMEVYVSSTREYLSGWV